MNRTGSDRKPAVTRPSAGDAALDEWLRQSLQHRFEAAEDVPDCLLRLCRENGDATPVS